MVIIKILFFHKNFESLGVEYLSSVLKEGGHKTDLVFDPAFNENPYLKLNFPGQKSMQEKMIRKAKQFSPDLVAFSSTTYMFPFVRQMAPVLKSELDVPIIVGGVHATMAPDQVLKEKAVDMVCIGEGEYALLDLANKLERGKDAKNTQNIWFKDGDRIKKNSLRMLVEDLDKLPFPDKDIFYKFGCFTDRVYMMAGRGCPYRCSYCFNESMQLLMRGKGKYVRFRSVRRVIDEIMFYRREYNIKRIAFEDDTFTLNHEWIKKFLETYREEVALPFRCLTRADTMTEEIASLLKSAGCEWVQLGLESGSEHIRKNVMNRNITNEQVIRAVNILKKAGMKVKVFSILGIVNETPEQMWETVRMNELLKPDALTSYTLVPYPQTKMLEYALKYGALEKGTYEKINSGFGSIHEESLLKHPHKNLAYNLKVILPLYNKSPSILKPVLKALMNDKKHSKSLMKLLYVLSIPFYSGGDINYKIKEILSMWKKCSKYYAA